ncbi:LysM peptidoglycan-binding domain-containing protein [Kribbella sp. NPDC048928]|uniref:LysM peptidoglycan-binding domain-containing protein n=1 Tax=Kribbella sp. NPDC048928 TaxID=3364111 RepID=UPI0037115524
MNAMIRVLKGTVAVLALAGLGLLLRWMTAGSITGLRTYDLDSLTVLAVGTIAWIAYIWLALAVVLTVLEQIPGVVGSLAGAIAGRITTKTARALLRSGLGVAAVTPLTIGAAHASPADSAHVRQVTQTNPQSAALGSGFRATEPASTIHLGAPQQAGFGATEAASTLEVGGNKPASRQETSTYRATEAASTLEVGGAEAAPRQDAADRRSAEAASGLDVGGSSTPQQGTSRLGDFRATEPASSLELGGATSETQRTGADNTGNTDDAARQQQTDDFRATEPGSKLHLTSPTPSGKPTPGHPTPTPSRPTPTAKPTTPAQPKISDSGRVPEGKAGSSEQQTTGGRVGVPDRPTDGAPTRYTSLRPNVPVSVVVRAGDSLWSIAARELGPSATNEAIAARWHDWYAANHHVIGNNPDLILPGQVLRTPPMSNGDHLPPHDQEQ